MEEKSAIRKIDSSVRALRVVVAFLFIFCCLLAGGISWLFIENRQTQPQLTHSQLTQPQLNDDLMVLKERRAELNVNLGEQLLAIDERSKRQAAVKPADGSDSFITDILLAMEGIKGPAGSAGESGKDGADGKDGRDGRDGRDAVCDMATIDQVNNTIQGMVKLEVSRVTGLSGAVYTRWGRTVCPPTSNLISKGIAAGTYSEYQGGASEYICLPEDPDLPTIPLPSRYTRISGVEYDYSGFEQLDKRYENGPCAVCQTTGRYVQQVFPAKNSCPDSTWTLEYRGYLMTEYYRNFRTAYICMDDSPETMEGLSERNSGAHWYHVVADCHDRTNYRTLGACPPYQRDSVLVCVVCSK